MDLEKLYNKLLLYPKLVLASVLTLVLVLGLYSFRVEIDASAETLLLKDDKDLTYSRKINEVYGSSNFLVITYTPKTGLLADKTLKHLQHLSDELLRVDSVDSIVSILNVPLLLDPSKSISDILKDVPTLQKDANKTLAKNEFLTSALYKQYLVSADFKTTALLLNIKENPEYFRLLNKRNKLLAQNDTSQLLHVEAEFKRLRDIEREKNHQTILKIREIIEKNRGDSQLFLGGVNMITDDMVSFVKSDLQTYGVIVLLLIILIIWGIFAQIRFVLIAIFIIFLSVLSMTGILGVLGLEITVISSNFVSLQMIITMSLVMHLSVRYKEILKEYPELSHKEIIAKSTASMVKPSFFVILTTIVGFASLVSSGIVPVMNLGWMMSAGVLVSLFITFIIFPSSMMLFKKRELYSSFEENFLLTRKLSFWVESYKKTILSVTLVLFAFSVSGAFLVILENSFIDYFKEDTEIYKGMKVIDKQLGGTTPLDIIINFDPLEINQEEVVDDAVDEFDEFEDELSEVKNKDQYWFTSNKMTKIEEIHDYLDSLPEIGKVLSLATTIKLVRDMNDGKDFDSVAFAYLYNKLPQEYKDILLKPYLSIADNQVRFSVRIIDSLPDLRRDELLKRITKDIHEKLGVKKENIRLSNMMVMYNNMLQSLFSSQIMTLSIVILSLFIMFLILFKSLKVAIIASLVNVVPIGFIFGFMGWYKIPLDMMTITVAAISLGIAVDDAIHYLYRFKIEVKKDGDYLAAMHRSHESIGNAMYYTTLVIMVGFSVLMLSNFYPTIHFGLLIMIAMFMAIVADLLLLPILILWTKPFKS
jgi:uncharacterized protein